LFFLPSEVSFVFNLDFNLFGHILLGGSQGGLKKKRWGKIFPASGGVQKGRSVFKGRASKLPQWIVHPADG